MPAWTEYKVRPRPVSYLMINSRLQVFVGVFSALAMAYVYSLLILICSGETADFVYFPLWAVAVTSWFVVPLGASLGLLIPFCVIRRSWSATVFAGAMLGLMVSCLVALLTTVWESSPSLFGEHVIVTDRPVFWGWFRDRLIWYTATMAPLCTLWVGTWAWLLGNRIRRIKS